MYYVYLLILSVTLADTIIWLNKDSPQTLEEISHEAVWDMFSIDSTCPFRKVRETGDIQKLF